MENFYTGLTGVWSTHNTFDIWVKGAYRQDTFGVELVSEEGRVHYYIRLLKKYRNMVESQIYAQYPEAQILEVEDYYNKFPKVIPNKDWDLWGADFTFVQSDPYYPIKTYDQFEESITGEMIDPMAAMVEAQVAIGLQVMTLLFWLLKLAFLTLNHHALFVRVVCSQERCSLLIHHLVALLMTKRSKPIWLRSTHMRSG